MTRKITGCISLVLLLFFIANFAMAGAVGRRIGSGPSISDSFMGSGMHLMHTSKYLSDGSLEIGGLVIKKEKGQKEIMVEAVKFDSSGNAKQKIITVSELSQITSGRSELKYGVSTNNTLILFKSDDKDIQIAQDANGSHDIEDRNTKVQDIDNGRYFLVNGSKTPDGRIEIGRNIIGRATAGSKPSKALEDTPPEARTRNPVMSAKNIDLDASLVRGGKEKAKEMGFNPIPVYYDDKGELTIVRGTLFSIRNGKWALDNGDMLINVGSRPVPAENIILQKGEYATVQKGKINKQPGSLLVGTENKISDAKHNVTRAQIELAGSVINFSEAAKYMSKESYFQMVKIPENNKLNGHFDGQGRIKVTSELPSLKISKSGSFAGNFLSLDPGDYIIFPQLFASAVYQTSNLVPTNADALLVPYEMKTLFLRNEEDKSLAVISIPENTKQRVLIDIGKVTIPHP